jgi:lipoprotein-anchoring transpeptidase ErfK/SrfK
LKIAPIPVILLSIVLFSACKNKKEQEVPKQNDTTAKTVAFIPEYKITYSLLTDSVKEVKDRYTTEKLDLILAINRIDRSALRRIDTLVLPDTFFPHLSYYTPFPEYLSFLDSTPKILLFSYKVQAFAAYENGRQIKWGPTSLGKKSTPTQTGLFHCNWRAKRTISTVNDEWILDWYVNIDNKGGVSMHQYELPGYPASHSCARLNEEDAKWIYDWIEQWELSENGQQVLRYGTPVIVFGTYDFKKKLHRNILNGKQAVTLEADTLKNNLQPLLLEDAKLRASESMH